MLLIFEVFVISSDLTQLENEERQTSTISTFQRFIRMLVLLIAHSSKLTKFVESLHFCGYQVCLNFVPHLNQVSFIRFPLSYSFHLIYCSLSFLDERLEHENICYSPYISRQLVAPYLLHSKYSKHIPSISNTLN